MKRHIAAAAVIVLSLLWLAGEASAQNRKLPKIGELWAGTESETIPYREPFASRMRELGWIDGKTAQFITRYGADVNQARTLAKELVALKVDVLLVTDFALPHVREATTTIPIVCMDMFDPVAEGATTSFARPNRNITGVSWQSIDTAAKRVEISRDLLPNLKHAALIYDATDPGAAIESKGFVQGAGRINAQLKVFGLRGPAELDAALVAIRKTRPDVLFISVSPFTSAHLDKMTRLANELRMPTVSEIGLFADAGVLLTYGVDMRETYSRAADLAHRILKGAKPRDLPFEQPRKFDVIVNMKTAKALGIKVPESIMLRAERVIR
jgi:putative tryptophan/tyrosine transport system substrate-binding protein